MVDDRLPNGKAAAFDASVYTEERTETSQRETKTASAVEYFERELAKMDNAVERLQEKKEKIQRHADAVDEEIAETVAARNELQAELESAQSQLEEIVSAEVAP